MHAAAFSTNGLFVWQCVVLAFTFSYKQYAYTELQHIINIIVCINFNFVIDILLSILYVHVQ